MGVNSRCGDSVLENVGCSLGLHCSANQTQPLVSSVCGDSAGNLDGAVKESLSVGEVGQGSLNGKSIGNESSADVKPGVNIGVEKGKCKPKCLDKCATFPCMSEVKPRDGSSEMEEEEHYNQAYSRSVSLPSPLKLLSAMKGSREKEGLSTEKLTVKWAADVYDPPVTLVSHTVNGNKQQKSRKRKIGKRMERRGKRATTLHGERTRNIVKVELLRGITHFWIRIK